MIETGSVLSTNKVIKYNSYYTNNTNNYKKRCLYFSYNTK